MVEIEERVEEVSDKLCVVHIDDTYDTSNDFAILDEMPEAHFVLGDLAWIVFDETDQSTFEDGARVEIGVTQDSLQCLLLHCALLLRSSLSPPRHQHAASPATI